MRILIVCYAVLLDGTFVELDATTTPTPSTSGNSAPSKVATDTESETNQSETSAVAPSAVDDVSSNQWSRPQTLLLLQLYKELQAEFSTPDKKKKVMWQKLAKMFNEKGYNVSWNGCEKKFRNLKQTFKNIKDNNAKTGRGKSTGNFSTFFRRFSGTIQLSYCLMSQNVWKMWTQNSQSMMCQVLALTRVK